MLLAGRRLPAAFRCLRQLTSRPASSGVSPLAMAAGMATATVAGVGIGLFLPTDWLVGNGKRPPSEIAKPKGRNSTVYEDVEDIAEEIPRPALIQDATREEVESLYEFQACLASGGSATVWRAAERSTGRIFAIKVIDKKLLPPALLNMEVYTMQRCAGHPNIVQLLAAYELEPDEANPNGEWHLVMELAEGGELFERLLQDGAYTEKSASLLIRQVGRRARRVRARARAEVPPRARVTPRARFVWPASGGARGVPPALVRDHAPGPEAREHRAHV